MLPRFFVIPILAVASLTLPACSSSSTRETTVPEASSTESAASVPGETYEIVDDATVAAGFAALTPLLDRTTTQLAAKDTDGAAATVVKAYTLWFTFEGTVRKVDQDRYLDLEDALSSVKSASTSGEADKAKAAAALFSKLSDTYLAAHPSGSADAQNTAAEAGPATRLEVQLNDYSIATTRSLTPGTYELAIKNNGKLDHEMIVFRTDLDPDALPTKADGAIDEKGNGVTFVDEREDIKPGTTKILRIELPAGKYVLACNVAGHHAKKMELAVTVG